MKIKQLFSYIITLSIVSLLSACGGGSDTPTAHTGQFIDSPVEGLSYSTATQSGTTDTNGTFTYLGVETVTFSIGDIVIGTATGDKTLTPLQLVNGATFHTDPVVTNIVQFLMLVDDDGDPANGIQITQAIRDAATGQSIDFTLGTFDVDAADINTATGTVINDLVLASSVTTKTLPSDDEAKTHFGNSLLDFMYGTYRGTTISGATVEITISPIRNFHASVTVGSTVIDSVTSNLYSTSISIYPNFSYNGVVYGGNISGNIDLFNGNISGNYLLNGVNDNFTLTKI